MSKVEQKSLEGAVSLEGCDYHFQAVVFRQVHYGAYGLIGATDWQFGNYSELAVRPSVPDRLRSQLELEILKRAKDAGPGNEGQEPKSEPTPDSGVNNIRGNSIQLEEKIGHGAYADVWRATDQKLGRKVAVKVLRPSSPYYFDAMAHARALARVQHANVVTIHSLEKVTVPDMGDTVDGVVMELVEGLTLKNRLEQPELFDHTDVFLLAEGLINGLEHIHSVGMVHSDLHDGNILVKASEAKIIDILYTDSLLRLTTGTKADKVRHDMRDLTTMLFDIARHSQLPDDSIRKFGFALQDSKMSFGEVRTALRELAAQSRKISTILIPDTVESTERAPTDSKLQQLKEAIAQERHNAKILLADYFSAYTDSLSDCSIDIYDNSVTIEERVWSSFAKMTPRRDEFIDMVSHICKNSNGIANYKREIIECLQQVSGYSEYRRPDTSYRHDWWNDNYKLFAHELFIYLAATLIKFKEYQMLYDLTHETYYIENRHGREFSSFVQFREYAHSLERRNNTLGLRLTMPEGTLFKERSTLADLPFDDLMQADFVLFLVSLLDAQPGQSYWFPVTLIYAIYHPTFRIFKQATAKRYFDEIKRLFGVQNKTELLAKYVDAIKKRNINNGQFQIASMEFISIPVLANLEELASR